MGMFGGFTDGFEWAGDRAGRMKDLTDHYYRRQAENGYDALVEVLTVALRDAMSATSVRFPSGFDPRRAAELVASHRWD